MLLYLKSRESATLVAGGCLLTISILSAHRACCSAHIYLGCWELQCRGEEGQLMGESLPKDMGEAEEAGE